MVSVDVKHHVHLDSPPDVSSRFGLAVRLVGGGGRFDSLIRLSFLFILCGGKTLPSLPSQLRKHRNDSNSCLRSEIILVVTVWR